MTTIATQIRARLDAIAAERARLDNEERRLKKALEALEETPGTPGLDAMIHERIVGPMYRDPAPLSSMPYPATHYPPPMSWRDGWVTPGGPVVVEDGETACGCGAPGDHARAALAVARGYDIGGTSVDDARQAREDRLNRPG